ncbi:MAG: hypothetical protein A07HN63_00320, partial [uncultured archaeon A07HN63]
MSDEADTGSDENHSESDEIDKSDTERVAGDIHATYTEADGERRLRFERD